MLVPLLTDAKWMTQDEFSRGTFYYDSFGARRVMGWLVTGRIFDNHRFPVVSVLALIGLGVCVWRFRRTETARAVPAVGLLSLLLFFGRPTLGFVIDVLPGATDLFLRRYVTGVHLAGIYLAGIGGAWAGTQAMRVVRTRAEWIKPAFAAGALGVVLIAVVAPAAAERYSYERTGAGWISEQRAAQSTDGADFASLVAKAKATAPGRIYGGMRANKAAPKILFVPAFAALLNLDADAVGFTRPTWSLMSNVENRFAAHVAAQVDMFGVRWAVLPAGRDAARGIDPVGDRRSVGALVDGRYRLPFGGRHGRTRGRRPDEPRLADGEVPHLRPPLAGSLSDAGVRRRAGRRAYARSRGRSRRPRRGA